MATGNGDDIVLGGDGGGSIYARTGNDVLTGGGYGNDTLAGDTGNDICRFAKGWGADVLADTASAPATTPTSSSSAMWPPPRFCSSATTTPWCCKRGTTPAIYIAALNDFYTYSRPRPDEQWSGRPASPTPRSMSLYQPRRITYSHTASESISAYYLPSGQTMYLRDGNDSRQGWRFNDAISPATATMTTSTPTAAINSPVDGSSSNNQVYDNEGNEHSHRPTQQRLRGHRQRQQHRLQSAMANDTEYAGAGDDVLTGGADNDTCSPATPATTPSRLHQGLGHERRDPSRPRHRQQRRRHPVQRCGLHGDLSSATTTPWCSSAAPPAMSSPSTASNLLRPKPDGPDRAVSLHRHHARCGRCHQRAHRLRHHR